MQTQNGTPGQMLPLMKSLPTWLEKLWTRLGVQGARFSGKARALQVVETLQLGGQKQLTLISIRGEHFLVGSGTHGVNTIVPVHTTFAISDQLQEQV